jgi:2-dehydro-3-deoxygalactonokinase
MESGRIAAFRTMMTGELFALLTRHSILADQLKGEVGANASFDAGVAEALAGGDLLGALFRIRARHLLGEEWGDPASYASGLLIGCDVRAGLAMHKDQSGGAAIALIGREDLCELYAAALAVAGQATTQLDGADAFLAGIKMLTEML